MKIKYVNKNYNPSTKFIDLLEKKIDKLDKYFDSDVEARVNLSEQAGLFKLELTINSKGWYFRSEVLSDNMYNNIDLALPKVEKQIIKHGQKYAHKMKKGAFDMPELLYLDKEPDVLPTTISRKKEFELSPISVEEAIAQMELLDHDFYVFLNKETMQVSVVYRRHDDNHGLIETIVVKQ